MSWIREADERQKNMKTWLDSRAKDHDWLMKAKD